jgi:nitrogen regulatory protein PII
MVAKFDLNDDSVVVIIGTGAGGGVLANELAQKGVKVVALEAGGRYLPEDYINDEWESFGQLAWLDPRTTSGDWRVAKDFSGLPAWIVKAVGGTTTHWAGASLRFQDHEWKALTNYGRVDGANLLDWPIDGAEMAPWYDKAETKLGVTRTGDRRATGPAPRGSHGWHGSCIAGRATTVAPQGDRPMKLITAIIKPFKVDDVRQAIADIGVQGVTVTEVQGFGRQRGHTEIYRGAEYRVDFLPKTKVEIAVDDTVVEQVIEAITNVARTGKIGDGKIFVTRLEQAVRIRTSESGAEAL